MQKKPALGSITSKVKETKSISKVFFMAIGHASIIYSGISWMGLVFLSGLWNRPLVCQKIKIWGEIGRGGWHSRIATGSTVCWTNRKNPFPFHDFCFVKAKKRIKQQRVMFSSIWTISTIWGILMHNQLVLANVEFSSRDAGEKWTIRITSMISGRARTSIEDWMGLLGEGLVKRLALSVVYVELEI